jgi:hypothetical protein
MASLFPQISGSVFRHDVAGYAPTADFSLLVICFAPKVVRKALLRLCAVVGRTGQSALAAGLAPSTVRRVNYQPRMMVREVMLSR